MERLGLGGGECGITRLRSGFMLLHRRLGEE